MTCKSPNLDGKDLAALVLVGCCCCCYYYYSYLCCLNCCSSCFDYLEYSDDVAASGDGGSSFAEGLPNASSGAFVEMLMKQRMNLSDPFLMIFDDCLSNC